MKGIGAFRNISSHFLLLIGNVSKKSQSIGERNMMSKTAASTKVCLTPPIVNTALGKGGGNGLTSAASIR